MHTVYLKRAILADILFKDGTILRRVSVKKIADLPEKEIDVIRIVK
jgi:hypothetical protein